MAIVAGNAGWSELLDDETLDVMPIDWSREGLGGLPLEPMFTMVLEAMNERLRWYTGLSQPAYSFQLYGYFSYIGGQDFMPVRMLLDSDQETVIESLVRPHHVPLGRVDRCHLSKPSPYWAIVPGNPWVVPLDRYANSEVSLGCHIATTEEPPEYPEVYSGENVYYLLTTSGWWTSSSGSGPWTLQTPGNGAYEWGYSYDPRRSPPKWWGTNFAFMLMVDTNQWTLLHSTSLDERGYIDTLGDSFTRWPVVPMDDDVFEAMVENFDGDGNPPRNVYITRQIYDWKTIVSNNYPGDTNIWTDQEMPFNYPLDEVPSNMPTETITDLMSRIGVRLYRVADRFVSPEFTGEGAIDGQPTDIESTYDWAMAQPSTDDFDAKIVFDAYKWDYTYSVDDTEVPITPLTLWLKTVRTILDNCSAVIDVNVDDGITHLVPYSTWTDWTVERREPDGSDGELYVSTFRANSYPQPDGWIVAIQGRDSATIYVDGSYVLMDLRSTLLVQTEITEVGGRGQMWMITLDTEYYGVVDNAQLLHYRSNEWVDVPFADVDGFLNEKSIGDFVYLGKLSGRICSRLEDSQVLPAIRELPASPPDPWDFTEPLSGYIVDASGWRLHRFSDLPTYKGD